MRGRKGDRDEKGISTFISAELLRLFVPVQLFVPAPASARLGVYCLVVPRERFVITTFVSSQWYYAPAYHDVARVLALSLMDLGYRAAISKTDALSPTSNGVHNIGLAYHWLSSGEGLENCIVYQLEQLDGPFLQQKWIDILRHAHTIWDYSQQNVAVLRRLGFNNVHYVPLGFHPHLDLLALPRQENIDVVFYGSVNQRRQAILDQLRPRCVLRTMVPVAGATATFGKTRDEMIAACKIVLNIHLDERSPMEQVRLSYLLNNRRFVISEQSPENPYGDALLTVPYDQLVATCLDYINRPEDRARWAAAGRAFMEGLPMARILAAALKEFPANNSPPGS